MASRRPHPTQGHAPQAARLIGRFPMLHVKIADAGNKRSEQMERGTPRIKLINHFKTIPTIGRAR
jgi:hypothetical protein